MRFEQGLDECHPGEVFDHGSLVQLLQDHALIVPFMAIGILSLPKVIQDNLKHLLILFEEMYTTSRGYDATWKAYQAEVALEKVIHGLPQSEADFQLSVSLCTSLVRQFSLSYQRGSLVSYPTMPPVLGIKSDLQMDQIQKLFPLCLTLDATTSLAGASLVMVVLGDIFKKSESLWLVLKSTDPPKKLVEPGLSIPWLKTWP